MNLFSSVIKRKVRQFVAVIVEENRCQIKYNVVKNEVLIESRERTFEISSKDKLGKKVTDFLNALQEDHDITYIALFLNTSGQGVIPACDMAQLEAYHIDKESVQAICVDNRFLMYATHIDTKWADGVFQNIGLDLVFSPFLVLDYYMQQEELPSKEGCVVLNILNTSNALTIMITKENQLLYGSFFNVAKDENLLYTDYSEEVSLDDDGALDELDFEDDDELEIEEIGSISDNSNFVNHVLKEQERLTDQDRRIIKYLSAALKEFYSDPLYHGEFIGQAKIYDGAGIDAGIMQYIENELLLDTAAVNISVKDAIIALSIQEVTV